MKKLVLTAILLATGSAVHAQAATSPAASAPATASSTKISPAKKQLVDKILKLQQPSIELLARSIAEAPLAQMGPQASLVLRRLPPDQRDAVGKGMQTDAAKYMSETLPLVKERAVALAPQTIGKVLEEKFTETELKQLVNLLESPIFRKFSEQDFVMRRALEEKLIADIRGTIESNVKAMDQSWAKRIQEATPATTDKAAPTAPAAPGPTSK